MFKCPHCGKAFGWKRNLDHHLRTHSPDRDRPYKCDQCTRAFYNSKTLRQHRSVHSDLRPFICYICEATFRRKDGLQKHVKNIHTRPRDVAKNDGTATECLAINTPKCNQEKPDQDQNSTTDPVQTFLPIPEISESSDEQLPEHSVLESDPSPDVTDANKEISQPAIPEVENLSIHGTPKKNYDKKTKVEHIMGYANQLSHASKCGNSSCTEIRSCLPIKELIKHEKECKTGEGEERCKTCFHFIVLSMFHSYVCQDKECCLKYCRNSSPSEEWDKTVQTIQRKMKKS